LVFVGSVSLDEVPPKLCHDILQGDASTIMH
jgi:hypothetical protein